MPCLLVSRVRYIYNYFISGSFQQKEKDKEEDFVCPEGTQGNGNFADPATCRRFYQVR